MQFNFHTHQELDKGRGIYNVQISEKVETLPDKTYFSAGIHPWDINAIDIQKSMLKLSKALTNDYCLALGEFGLDKSCGVDMQLQMQLFSAQLEMAKLVKRKLLIIHCVKAYQELISFKSRIDDDFIWVLHGFNGSKQLIEQLLKQDFYFSLGSLLFHDEAKIAQSIKYIPLNRLFLETDDSLMSIDEVYRRAASLLEINIKKLEQQLEQNLNSIFSFPDK